MGDPTDLVPDFVGRAELEGLLGNLLPSGWAAAVRAGRDEEVQALKSGIDSPTVVRALGDAGWVAPHYAPEHGGRGLDVDDARSALTLLVAWDVPHIPRGSGLPLAAPTIQQWSSDETKRRLLPPLLNGSQRWCQLFSEPGAGSDMASLATTAVRDGDEWIVNGQKVWTTYGHESEMAMLIARTDTDAPKHKGITYFGLDMNAPGVEVRPLINIAGQLEFNEIFLTDVRVPDLDRISPVGEGWAAAMTTLGAERHALSGARRKRRASDEILGGKPFAEVAAAADAGIDAGIDAGVDGVIRDRLAGAHVADRLLALTAERAKARARAGKPAGPEGSITKIAKAIANQQLQELALDVVGPSAVAWDRDEPEAAEWATQFLRTRANSIEGGTSEIQRNIVGERVLGLPREPDQYRGLHGTKSRGVDPVMSDDPFNEPPAVVTVGDARVTAIAEQPLTGLNHLIAMATPDAVREIDWMVPDHADENGELLGVIQAFVIEVDDVTIVVDTCIGNGKDLPVAPHWSHLSTDFPTRLADAGLDTDAVDVVLCTHLHLDHVGWNTTSVDGEWVPTFPNARHVLVRRELDHWRSETAVLPSEAESSEAESSDDRERAQIAWQQTQANVLTQSVEPLFDADLVELVDAPHLVAPGVRLIPTPGHTPGHVSVEIDRAGQRAIITGDCFHHPCQIARPDWSTRVDADREQSSATRVQLLEDIAGTECLLIGTHFTAPFAGRVVWSDGAHRLAPVDSTE